MSTQKQYSVEITTSPDFIQMMGKKLYSNPLLAILTRELVQNSRDATVRGAHTHGKINVTLAHGDLSTTIVCDDTGIGMSEDTLVNTFLQIGGSANKEANSVGGFGVAKVSLFATGQWSVTTKNNHVDSSLVYNQVPDRKGTRVEATIKHTDEFKQDYAERLSGLFLASSNIKNLWLNGDKIRPYKMRRLLDVHAGAMVGTAGKLNGTSNKIFYRIHGLTQYVDNLGYGDDYGFNVIVDFEAIDYKPRDDNYPFDVSREKVQSHFEQFVRMTVAPLAKNVLTSRHEHGYENKPAREHIQHRAKSSDRNYIIVEAPKHIDPVDRNILALWREMFDVIQPDRQTGFGLTYDMSTAAERRSQDGREYFLINPICVRNEWRELLEYNPADATAFIWIMWHLAAHELTHRTESDHVETFTTAEHTTAIPTGKLLGKKMDSLKPQARKCLKGIVKLNVL